MKNLFLLAVSSVAILATVGCGQTPVNETSNTNTGSSNNVTDDQTNNTPSGDPTDGQLSGTECGDGALLSYNCWTSRFPADIYGKGDVSCSFLISCCGKDIGNGWTTVYSNMAGLRGFVDSGSVISKASCKDLPALDDLDGDSTPNESDVTPTGGDKNTWEEKAENDTGR